MHIESQMLKMYAKLLLEMLTNRHESQSSETPLQQLELLQIDPELKCICTSACKPRPRPTKWTKRSTKSRLQVTSSERHARLRLRMGRRRRTI